MFREMDTVWLDMSFNINKVVSSTPTRLFESIYTGCFLWLWPHACVLIERHPGLGFIVSRCRLATGWGTWVVLGGELAYPILVSTQSHTMDGKRQRQMNIATLFSLFHYLLFYHLPAIHLSRKEAGSGSPMQEYKWDVT